MSASITRHEEAYRGAGAVRKFGDTRITVFGAGALGSNLAETLARQGCNNLFVLDRDRVERHNVGTQVYGLRDVGRPKVDALLDRIYAATGVEIGPINKTLGPDNVKRYVGHPGGGPHLLVDCFDNSDSRNLLQQECRRQEVPCLHAGLFEGYGEVIWDQQYRVPSDPAGGDVCDYPLARNIVQLAVTVAAEAILCFLSDGRQRSFRITLGDLQIREL